jgi:hypothetical protein
MALLLPLDAGGVVLIPRRVEPYVDQEVLRLFTKIVISGTASYFTSTNDAGIEPQSFASFGAKARVPRCS